MNSCATETLHAGCVAIDGHGVLIEGASGSGKSDLALRLIDRGALLVSDDYTAIDSCDGQVTARAPATIAGRIEVRGVGIIELPYRSEAHIALCVTLGVDGPRMPEASCFRRVADVDVPTVLLDARAPSAPLKVEIALREALAQR